MTLRFAYTIIYVGDVRETLDFYERAFGLPPSFLHEDGAYAELDTGPTTLAFAEQEFATSGVSGGCHANDIAHPPAGMNLTFTTEDPAAAFRRAIDAGALAVHQPSTKPWGQTVALVRDLNGVLVEIATPMSG